MKVLQTSLPGVLILEPAAYADERGLFFESFNAREFAQAVGGPVQFVQDNHSYSKKGVLRGLHYQIRQAQGKLVRTTRGEAWDVAVDIRRSSPHFGKWVGALLSAENRLQMWIPPGFAHGFLSLSDTDFLYKTTDYFAPEHARSILWNDPAIGIEWPVDVPLLSPKDREAPRLGEAEVFD